MPGRVVRAVLSGSFHEDRDGLRRAYDELVTCGCQVLSPHRLDLDEDVTFVRDSAERWLSAADIECHHLTSIAQSDFVWLHAPDGYVGVSAAIEIGYAIAHDVPVFTNAVIDEPGFATQIRTVASVYAAIVGIAST